MLVIAVLQATESEGDWDCAFTRFDAACELRQFRCEYSTFELFALDALFRDAILPLL